MSLLITIVTFAICTIGVALYAWYKTKDTKLETKEGYFLGGRSLSGMVIAGSLLMTNLSAEQLVGNNGQSVRIGMSPIGWEVTSALALVILAYCFMPKYMKSGLSTIPEFLGERYDEATHKLVSFIVLLSYVLVMLPTILYAGAQVFVSIFHVDSIFLDMGVAPDVARFEAVACVCVAISIVGTLYAVCGGLKAIATSDAVNGIGLIIGGLMVPIFGLIALGEMHGGGFSEGVHQFLNQDPTMLNAIDPWNANEPYLPWPILFTGMLINNLYFWGTNQSIIQRTFGAKNLEEAQKGVIYAGFMKIATPLIIVVPGIIACFLFPEITDWGNGDTAYPMLVATVMPKPLLGFFAAVMFGAILSSYNATLQSASTIYSLDIHRYVVGHEVDETKLVKVGKRFSVCVSIFATVLSPFIFYLSGITTVVNSAFAAFNTPIFVCLLVGFFWKRVTARSAKIVICFHVVTYLLLQFVLRNIIPALAEVHYLYFTAGLFCVDMLFMYLLTKVDYLKEEFKLRDAKVVDMTPWKNGKYYAAASLIIMVLAYMLCSPLGIGAWK